MRDLDAVPLPVSCEADDLGARVGAYTVYDDQNQDAMNALYKTRFGNLPSSNRRVSALRFISQENNTIIFISENLSSRYRAGAVRHELCHAACDLDPQVDCIGHFAPNGMEK